jgi:hypothetical protein
MALSSGWRCTARSGRTVSCRVVIVHPEEEAGGTRLPVNLKRGLSRDAPVEQRGAVVHAFFERL